MTPTLPEWLTIDESSDLEREMVARGTLGQPDGVPLDTMPTPGAEVDALGNEVNSPANLEARMAWFTG